jgi:mono/diheme cytochrome c family protein
MRSACVLSAALALAICSPAQTPKFDRDVLPIFTANCFSCHGGRAMVGLDLRTAQSTLKGSDQGPVVIKGDPEKSPLYQKLVNKLMPPPAFNFKVTEAQIEVIKKWIEAGAPSEEAEARAAKLAVEAKRFDEHAAPIFQARCTGCHGGEKPAAGLDLRTLAAAVKGSASGPVVVEGAADKSILIRRIVNKTMPPKGAGEPLDDAQIAALTAWVDGAYFGVRDQPTQERTAFTAAEAPPVSDKDRKHWAFRAPVKSEVPAVKERQRVRTGIDNFVLAKLEAKGFSFSADASKTALLRRAYFDLTGLPPTPEDAQAYLADTRPGAYERLIDKLLASPQFGERWARHWLDAAGYTDASGFDNDLHTIEVFEGIWRYRDYVIKAFNQDKPYDKFLVEQFAGDELYDWRNATSYTPEMLEALTATGYLRSVYDRTDPDIVNLPGERFDVLFHLAEKVSTGVMGVTMGCARCHSHKYDPIPQRDYYRFLAVFMSSYNPFNWKQPKDRFLPDVPKGEQEKIEKHNAEIDGQVKELDTQRTRLRKPYEEKLLDAKLLAVSAEVRMETKAALAAPKEQRDTVQQFLVTKFGKQLEIKPEEIDKALSDADRDTNARLDQQIKTLNGYRRTYQKIQALWDVGQPPVARLLERGVVENPGPRVTPGIPEVLRPPGETDVTRPAAEQGQTSGSRLAFARWLASRNNPLTARVFVNRVWMHLVGRGIVETPDNFGRMGAAPTHPELLDWLAVDFMENGWSTKRLIGQIMRSSVYRQSSRQPTGESAAKRADPGNKLLWRMNLKRLEAEAVRDAVLSVSGKLDPNIGGPAVLLSAKPDGLQSLSDKEPTPNGSHRRSMYIMARRNYPINFLQVFDYPTIQTNCTRRINSATPLQSLAMMNDDFVVEQARLLSERAVQSAKGKGAVQCMEAAWLITLSRKPTADELRMSQEHVARQTEVFRTANVPAEQAAQRAFASLCQMLLATNEFLYVE